MSELDVAKERIAYLKVWLGILVITDISTFGWLISNVGAASGLLLWAAVVAVVALTAGIVVLHRRIDRHIHSLRQL
jgi:cytochrome c oxidase subunit IV